MTKFTSDKDLAQQEIVAIARSILTGGLGIVEGARKLCHWRFTGAEHDQDLMFFVAVDSETDHLPIANVQAYWQPEALKEKLNELKTYEDSVRTEAFRVCENLIKKFEVPDA